MRLVCPNCAATYEVPEDAIPDTGRDVQCASCGHAWFFLRPEVGFVPPDAGNAVEKVTQTEAEITAATEALPEPEPAATTEPALSADSPAAAEPADALTEEAEAEAALAKALTEDAPSETAESKPEPREAVTASDSTAGPEPTEATAKDPETRAPEVSNADTKPDDGSDEEDDEDFEAYSYPAPGAPAPGGPASGAYATDGSVLTILREEAEREAMARRGLALPLESQPDLGVEAAMPDRQTAAAMAEAAGDDGTARSPARRDLLPDVEEINSTLRPTETGPESGPDSVVLVDRSGGFRSGFLMVMTLSIIGAGVYTLEPRISTQVPALAEPLETYVGSVDALRLALDGIMRSATVALNGG